MDSQWDTSQPTRMTSGYTLKQGMCDVLPLDISVQRQRCLILTLPNPDLLFCAHNV